jgi:sporulation protein YlmC with PRC-barrel domain
MFNTISSVVLPLIAGSLFLAATVQADDEKSSGTMRSQCSADEIIGTKVKNLQDEDLGKVQDLIVNFQSGTVPYAVIAHGGVLGAGRTRTAVPLDSLHYSSDAKAFVLAATKEQLRAATKSPANGWAQASDAEWARNVDGFYGNPMASPSGIDRERSKGLSDRGDRTYVRDPAPKGAEVLATPADTALCEKICESVDFVHVRVENGVTHIYGRVDDEETRKNLEAKVRAVQGVNKVESHLRVKNP